MVTERTHRAAYRALVRLYPAQFRGEYGQDLEELFADCLHDEPAARVWRRTVSDLAFSVPRAHWEEGMKHTPKAAVLTVAAGMVVLATPTFLWPVAALLLFGAWRLGTDGPPLGWASPPRTIAAGLIGGAACLAVGMSFGGTVLLTDDLAWEIGFLGAVAGPGLVLAGVLRLSLQRRRVALTAPR